MSTIVTTIDPERQTLGEVEMVGRERWEEIHRRWPADCDSRFGPRSLGDRPDRAQGGRGVRRMLTEDLRAAPQMPQSLPDVVGYIVGDCLYQRL